MPAAILVLLVAFALRMWDLDRLPGGVHFDLGANLLDVEDVLNGKRALYFHRNNGREPLIVYAQALSAAALGVTPFAARVVTVALGMLGVAAVGFAARQAWTLTGVPRAQWAALFGAAAMATMYWGVHFDRFGLRTALVPFFAAMAVGCALRGLKTGGVSFLVSGAALGLGLLTYTGARLLPLAVAVPLAFGCRWHGLMTAAAVAAALFAPLGWFYLGEPGAFSQHTWDTSVLRAPDPAVAAARGIVATAGAFVAKGSPGAGENLPARALLDPLAAIAFVIGLGVTLSWLRSGGAVATVGLSVLGWLATMSLASALAVPAPGFLRLSGAVPAAAVLCGIGATAVVLRLPGLKWRWLAFVGFLTITSALTARDYFATWGEKHAYRAAMSDKAEAAQWLVTRPPDERLFLAPLWATDFGVQYVMRRRLPQSFDAGAGFVLPSTAPALYAFPYEDRDGAHRVAGQLPGQPMPSLLRDATGRYDLLWTVGPVRGERAPFALYQLEDGIALTGVELPQRAAPGEPIAIVLRWLAETAPTRDYTVFIQLRDASGTRAQSDRRPVRDSAPTVDWRPGDVVVDRHELRLPSDLGRSLDAYAGVYLLSTGERLKVRGSTTDEVRLGVLPVD